MKTTKWYHTWYVSNFMGTNNIIVHSFFTCRFYPPKEKNKHCLNDLTAVCEQLHESILFYLLIILLHLRSKETTGLYITYNSNHRAISYYHPWSVFRADSLDHTSLKHTLIQLVLYIRDLLFLIVGFK